MKTVHAGRRMTTLDVALRLSVDVRNGIMHVGTKTELQQGVAAATSPSWAVVRVRSHFCHIRYPCGGFFGRVMPDAIGYDTGVSGRSCKACFSLKGASPSQRSDIAGYYGQSVFVQSYD